MNRRKEEDERLGQLQRWLNDVRSFPCAAPLLTVLAVLHLIGQLTLWVPRHLGNSPDWQQAIRGFDMYAYYLAADRVRHGEPLYTPWPDYGPYVQAVPGIVWRGEEIPYPPPFPVALVPVARLPYPVFARWWYVPLLLAFWTYAACLAYLATGSLSPRRVLIGGLALGLVPGTYGTLRFGNVDPLLWAAFGLALVSPRLRGALLAAVGLVKLHALWPLALTVHHERCRTGLPAALVLGGGVAWSLTIVGWAAWRDWWLYVLPTSPLQATFHPANVSLAFAGLRLARSLGWHYALGPLPTAARLYLTIVGLAVPLGAVWATRRLSPLARYTVVMAAVVLFSPLCWAAYLAFLLAPLALLCHEWMPPSAGSTAYSQRPGPRSVVEAGLEGRADRARAHADLR